MLEKLNEKDDTSRCPIAVIIRDHQILLGHRHYTPLKESTLSVWTCPGGRCDSGETVETTLRREVEEEVGITDLSVEKYLGEFAGAIKGDRVPVFLCSTEQEAQNLEPHKFSEWKWFTKTTFPDTFINQDIAKYLKTLL